MLAILIARLHIQDKKIDFSEPDNKVLLHELQEKELIEREKDPEKFNYELKQ